MTSENHLVAALRASSAGRAEAVFARSANGAMLSYGDFFAGAEKIAAVLVGLGVQPGDRMAVQIDKSLEALQLYVGAVMAGGVFLPLNTGYTAAEVAYFLTDAAPTVAVCDPSRHGDLAPIATKAGVAHLMTLDGAGEGSLKDAADAANAGFVPLPRGEDDLAAILYTSGTTGRSKGAMMSHRNLASNASTLATLWGFTKDDILIHALPIFHTHGLFVATNVALMSGCALHFMPKFDADQVLTAMPNATALMGVPTFYTRLLKSPELAYASRNMRLFISGSAPLLAETHDQWRDVTGHAILERYGMTETNMITSNPLDGDRRAGTVGFPLPGVEVKITNPESGDAVPNGEPGVIEVRGPNVFSGYWNMPEKTKEELRENGFFITGDIAVKDERGYVSIVGRAKDLIISGGYNVYPKEIELLIDDVDGVLESAVVAAPHPDFGEAVVAVVVPQAPGSVEIETIQAAASTGLARFKQPKHIELIAELPRNTMGKVQKNVLREQFKTLYK